ncbi:hypothetical protein B0J11DRAFT_66410 [Dendryphion nanum]|uniref:Nitrogen regulatory protein areA GATA-like domain-containing protein n=1 Tax=Dendryphion nanum TaxID=256645 RepID=A0A9P9DI95_9PLEO|nr:hypothetical protein B0J11DRAFT_66410 [Dendryphion nanum]
MPLYAERPIVRVEPGSMHSIETRDVENLFGLWSVFSKCAVAMEDGKRYENMAWRLWSRETFCCAPDHSFSPRWSFGRQLSTSAVDMPELSSSVASDDSAMESAIASTSRSNSSSRPEIRRHDSSASQARGKHITPIDLEKVVSSIQEKKTIEPLSPLPPQLAPPPQTPCVAKMTVEDTTPRPSSPPPTASFAPESSTSTVATNEDMSPLVGSETSSSENSTHSVVHGFEMGRISTSIRSSTNLASTPSRKISFPPRSEPTRAELPKRNKAKFTLGCGSSEEEDRSSFEASFTARSSLTNGLKKNGGLYKSTSFKPEVSTRTYHNATASEDSEAIESAIETDSESETDNAIEEEEEDSDWEDDTEDPSGPASFSEKEIRFPRIDSKPNLTSHRSILSSMLHEGDRAKALQNIASRSTPAIRRSRTTTPNGPSTGNSPQEDQGLMMRTQTRAKPIIMTTSNVHPPALSPRTTRRNMLQTELTQSLRQNLLWERQQKNATTNAVNKRQHSAVSIPALRRAATTNDIKGLKAFPQQAKVQAPLIKEAVKNNNSYNDYFDQGLQEYHQKGW